MLVEAFVAEALENVPEGAIRTAFERRIGSWVAADGEQAA